MSFEFDHLITVSDDCEFFEFYANCKDSPLRIENIDDLNMGIWRTILIFLPACLNGSGFESQDKTF